MIEALDGAVFQQDRMDAVAVIETAEAMYRLHHARIHSLCMSFLRNSADAEDAVQESFARLARQLPRLAGDPSAYLTVIARNVCRDELRRRLHEGPEISELLEAAGSTESRVIDGHTLRDIWGQLSPRERLLLAHQAAGYRMEEIASRTGLTLNAATVGVSRAKARARVLAARAQGMVVLAIGRATRPRLSLQRLLQSAGSASIQSAVLATTLLAVVALPVSTSVAPAATVAQAAGGVSGSGREVAGGDGEVAVLGPSAQQAPAGSVRVAAAGPSQSQGGGRSHVLGRLGGLGATVGDLLGPADPHVSPYSIGAIAVSPSFSGDHTVFATGNSIAGPCSAPTMHCDDLHFISVDSGHSWQSLALSWATDAGGQRTTPAPLSGPLLVLPDYLYQPGVSGTATTLFMATPDGLAMAAADGRQFYMVAPTPTGKGQLATVLPHTTPGHGRIVVPGNPLLYYDEDTAQQSPTQNRSVATLQGPVMDPGTTIQALAGVDRDNVIAVVTLPSGAPALLNCPLDATARCGVLSNLSDLGTGNQAAPASLVVSPSFDTDQTLLLYSGNQAWLSRDKGAHLQPVDLASNLPITAMALASDFGGSRTAVIAQADDSNNWAISRSVDGGATFNLIRSGGPHASLHLGLDDLQIRPDGVLMGGIALPDPTQQGGLRCSADGGQTWHRAC